jgi:signal transduction histidine kinase
VEAFHLDGTRVAGAAADASSPLWPTEAEMHRLREGDILTTTQLRGRNPRALAYVMLPTAADPVLLRIAADASDLAADLRDRQETFLAQGLGLVIVMAAVALLAPGRREDASSTPPVALAAYEEAMERMRARDEELSRQHQVERRRMEGELRAREPFVRAGELTVGIVHEIRNALGTIVGYARLIEQSQGAAAAHARVVRDECETLEGVVQRFMEFVKDEALQRARFDLGRLLGRVSARESRGRPGRTITLPAHEVGAMEGDEDLLERVFENLIRNALDAAGPGGRVGVEVERRPDAVVVTVEDDGPGMSPELRANLRPFVTTKQGGLGLGLAIAMKIVKLHGGELVLADRRPHGLAAIVTLPTPRAA